MMDAGSSPAVPAALGAVLGVVLIASTIIIILLLVRMSRLRRNLRYAQDSVRMGPGPQESNYPLYAKDVAGEESPEELRRQLAQVRGELTAVNVLAPSTIRDQSDYVREMTLLNNNIRQMSMQINRNRSRVPAATIRTMLCSAIWSTIFAKFDASLDERTDGQMQLIMSKFPKPSECGPAEDS